MKAFKIIFAALAATAALAGCAKETTLPSFENDKVNPVAEGTRVIAISFAPQTKTSYTTTETGGIQPTFEGGESILLVSYPEDTNADPITETTTVQFDKKTETATISTNLTGELTAYYPASLASFSAKRNEWYIFVPSEQKDGTFANANICSTTIAENATSANFENMYALFVITPPEGTKKLTIKSLRTIGEEGQRSVEDRPIICGTGDDSFKITVGDGTAVIPSPCYVAMIGGNVNLSDLSFEATFDEEGTTGYIKGITTSAIAANAGTGIAVGSEEYDNANTVRDGTAYTIDGNNWHGYVEIGGRKWATMNIGAESPADDGYYLAWGATEVAYDSFDGTTFVFKQNAPASYSSETWDSTKGFDVCNAPSCVTSKYNKDNMTLELCDDAAYVNWGGAWRMPTSSEFETSICFNTDDVKIVYVDDESKRGYDVSCGSNQIFIPYTKYGDALHLDNVYFGGIWLSSKGSQYGYFQMGSTGGYGMSSTPNNKFGRNIRAIVDEPVAISE